MEIGTVLALPGSVPPFPISKQDLPMNTLALRPKSPKKQARRRLDAILKAHPELSLDENTPFVIYLTERMVRDIKAYRQTPEQQRLRVTWPSLN
jgi:hypothetical protein